MPTTIAGLNIVTLSSGHKAPGTPAISPSPPTPPAGPIPVPYMYVAPSANAAGSMTGKLKSDKVKTFKKSTYIDPITAPANGPSQPCAILDIVTHAKCMEAHPMEPTTAQKTKSGNEQLIVTGDKCCLNVLTKDMQLCQSIGPFLEGADFDAKLAAGTLGNSIKILTVAEPVAVASGNVVDDAVDLTDGGLLPVVWKRTYSTARRLEWSPLGAGGWTHSLDQWIRLSGDGLLIREADAETRVPRLAPRESYFDRATRHTITRLGDKSYTIFNANTQLTREYVPVESGNEVAMLRSIRDAWGHEVLLHYEGGHLFKVTGTTKRELRVVRNRNNLVTQVEVWARGTLCAAVKYEYDDASQLAAAHDVVGGVERYAYDGNRRMVEKARKNGVRFYYVYDKETGMCRKAWGDGGLHSYVFDYDLKAGVTVAHGNPQPRRFVRNARGAIVRVETFDGILVRDWTYDDDGYLLERKDASGTTLTFEWDARGNLLKQVDAAGNEHLWEYDDDRLIRWTQPGGMVTEYGHDRRGERVSARDSIGRSTRYDYDEHGRLVAVFGESRPSWRYEYDEEHNIVKIISPYGGAWAQTFDSYGLLVSRTDPFGNTAHFEFDLGGHMLLAEECDGRTRRCSWDALGSVAEIVTPGGRTMQIQAGGTGAPTRLSLGDGQVWEWIRDVNEELAAVRNPRGELFEFRRNRAAHVVQTTAFDGPVTRYAMSKNEMLSRIEYDDGTYREFGHDALGQLVEERTPHGTRRFERDQLGRVVEAVLEEHNGKVVVEFERGVDRQPEAESLNGRETRYEIDARRKRVARTLPNGQTTRFGYDESGSFAFFEHDGHRLSLERDKAGREIRRKLHRSGVEILTSFDHRHRPVVRSVVRPSENRTLVEYKFEYNGDDRVTTMHDSVHGSFLYNHDSAGRLVGARGPDYDERFEYDVAGSLVGIYTGGKGDPWTMAKGGKVLRTPFAEYAYDRRGRRIRKTALAGWQPTGHVTEYAWDCRDQLREVRLPGGARVLYTYDAYGRRVRKEIVPATPDVLAEPKVRVVEYFWEQDGLAMEIDSERGSRTYVLAHGSLEPILQAEQGRVEFFVVDQIKSPLALVMSDGTLRWSGSHTPWGRPLGATPPTPFRLLGQYGDEETGLCYTRFRYFDPEIGAWLSPDPIGMSGGANLYAFNGDPTCYADVLGLVPCDGFGNVQYTVENGRITGMNAIVTKDMIDANAAGSDNKTGTDAAQDQEPEGRQVGEPRGHILANSMGGPGSGPMAQYNLMAMTTSGNSGQMSPFEVKVGQDATSGGPTYYNVDMNGGGPSADPSGSCATPGQASTPSTRPPQVDLDATNAGSGAPVGPNPGPIKN